MTGRRRRRPWLRLIGVPVLVALAVGAAIALVWWPGSAALTPQGVLVSAPDSPATSATSSGTPTTARPSDTPSAHPATPTPTRTTTHAAAGTGGSGGSAPAVPPVAATVPPGAARSVTFVNDVRQTIWVAAAEQTATPALSTTGWVLPPGQSVTITVPDKWNGRFWGRTGCSFDAAGYGHCQTGDCAGRFQCAQYGTIPATLAEFNLNSWDNLDFYDVSMVDGSNLPMYINIAHGATKDPISAGGCSAAGCARPVICPSALQIKAGGAVVGCESACGVFNTDQYCCRGQWAPRSACQPTQWPVDYAAVFKSAEPFAYSYVDDDATSTFTCAGECGYRITFGLSP